MTTTTKEILETDWQWNQADHETMKTAALVDIAKSARLMARRYSDLIDERDALKKEVGWLKETLLRRDLSNAALKGVITKLRKAKSE